MDTLTAQLDLGRTRLDQAQRLANRGAGSVYDVEQFTGQVEQLEAQLDGARWNLEETKVRAPADGFVTSVSLREGARVVNFPFVQAMAFVETQNQFLGGQIFQNHLRYVEPGLPAEIALKMYPGRGPVRDSGVSDRTDSAEWHGLRSERCAAHAVLGRDRPR